ncbi:MAG: Ig domain-containing protein [Bacteroidales bacterium]|nr:Ig domain-containing protein [Bacteroidales bacterium]
MKKILNCTSLLIAFTTFVSIVSCQKEMAPDFTPEEPSAKEYTLTVDATKGDDTKALSLDDNTLNVKWAGTDQVSVFSENWATTFGILTADASETGSTTLTGTLSPAPTAGDNLNLLFPRGEWNYTGQKGTLLSDASSIEKKYDYALATVTVDEVNAGEITTTASANFTSQQAIVKFRLTDGTDPIAVNSLKIEASSNKLVVNKSYRGAGSKTYYYGSSYYSVDGGSGGFGGEEHGNLVDNNLDTKWCANKPSGNWYIEFHTASAIQVDGYMLRTGGDTGSWGNYVRNPRNWVLYGKKNSGDSWSIIDTKTDNYDMPTSSNAEKDFDADAPGQYKFFRLEISAVRDGNCMQLSEMRLFSYEYYEMGTTYGAITVTPDDAASELTVALRNENASADTYTLTATVGSGTYTFSKSGIAFENGKYYDIRVPMNPKKVSSIYLNKTSASLLIGGTVTLSVSSSYPSDAVDKTVSWSSSNTSVATVNASTGEVTAVAGGTATITATANDGGGATATCSVTVYPAGTIVWDSSNISDLNVSGTYTSYTKEGITLSANADMIDAWYYMDGISFNAHASGGFTFTAPTGKQFTKIEMTLNGSAGWDIAAMESKLGTGWVYSEDYMTGIYKVTWTGTAASVGLLTGADDFSGEYVKSIAFFVE